MYREEIKADYSFLLCWQEQPDPDEKPTLYFTIRPVSGEPCPHNFSNLEQMVDFLFKLVLEPPQDSPIET